MKQQRFERSFKRISKDFGKDKKYCVAYEITNESFARGEREKEPGMNYYYYSGPLDEKTRDFCKYLLKLDKVFSEEEIDFMTSIIGYSVIKYAGSYNCRHRWIKFRGKIINTPAPTVSQIDRLISININS